MKKKAIKVREKYSLIKKIINYKNEGLFISFEGKLKNYSFEQLDGITLNEGLPLKRNVIEPVADFFVFDLKKLDRIGLLKILEIEDALEWDIFHIKIADNKNILFESYDWFSDCYICEDYFGYNFLNELSREEIIKPI